MQGGQGHRADGQWGRCAGPGLGHGGDLLADQQPPQWAGSICTICGPGGELVELLQGVEPSPAATGKGGLHSPGATADTPGGDRFLVPVGPVFLRWRPVYHVLHCQPAVHLDHQLHLITHGPAHRPPGPQPGPVGRAPGVSGRAEGSNFSARYPLPTASRARAAYSSGVCAPPYQPLA